MNAVREASRVLSLEFLDGYVWLHYPADFYMDLVMQQLPGAKLSRRFLLWAVEEGQIIDVLSAILHDAELKLKYWPPVGLNERSQQLVQNLLEVDQLRQLDHNDLTVPDGLVPDEYRIRTYQYQTAMVALKNYVLLMALDMGTGKSLTALVAFKMVLSCQEDVKALVVCPATCKQDPWVNELRKFAPELSYTVVEGGPRERERQYRSNAHVVIVNYDLLTRDYQMILSAIKNENRQVGIWDETSLLKNQSTARWKKAEKICQQQRWRWFLNGTPLENNLMDVYDQVKLLNPHLFGSPSHFRHRYCVSGEFGTIRPGVVRNAEELRQYLDPLVVRITVEDVAEQLPEKIVEVLWLEADPIQEQVLKQLDHDIDIPIEAYTRLQQACDDPHIILRWAEGTYPAVDLITRQMTDNPKIERLQTLLTNELAGEKVVVFCKYRKMQIILEEVLASHNPLVLHGQLNQKDRTKAIQAFQTDPERRLFLTTTAGVRGLNLSAGSCVILFDIVFNPAVMDQMIARVRRLSSTHQVIRAFYLLVRDSIEARMWDLLEKKRKTADIVIEGEGMDLTDRPPVKDMQVLLNWSAERYQAGLEKQRLLRYQPKEEDDA